MWGRTSVENTLTHNLTDDYINQFIQFNPPMAGRFYVT